MVIAAGRDGDGGAAASQDNVPISQPAVQQRRRYPQAETGGIGRSGQAAAVGRALQILIVTALP